MDYYLKFSRFLSLLVLLTAGGFNPASSIAQGTAAQQFANADWFTRPLGVGVVWKYYQFDNLFNSRQSISYIEADLDLPGVRIELPYLNGRQRTTNMIKAQFPAAAAGVNATFFSVGGHKTFLKVSGNVIPPDDPWGGRWAYSGGLVFNRNTNSFDVIRQPSKAPVDGAWWSTNTAGWTDVIVNGPLLLQNGNVTAGQFPDGTHCNRNPRTMVGKKPGNKLVLVVVDGRHPGDAAGLTCDEMAEVMLALGCTDATSYDGGGSSAMYARNEPNNGLVSYPSDNYDGYDMDTRDERSVANGIAIMANYTSALPWDARLETLTVPAKAVAGQRVIVSAKFRNIGTQTWTSSRVSITTSRPFAEPSELYDPQTWTDNTQPWRVPAGTSVPPNGLITASFAVLAPEVPGPLTITDYFQLTIDGAQRFGPADNKIRVDLAVSTNPSTFIVEPRSGGQNQQWYSDTGFADANVNCLVGTADIGMRYGSTYRSKAGAKSAKWTPLFPGRAFYRVHAAWGDGSLRRSPVTYHITHRGGKTTFNINQAAIANEWVWLGSREFEFDAGQTGQGVEMTNENIDVSGNMYAGPVAFQYMGTSSVSDWQLYE